MMEITNIKLPEGFEAKFEGKTLVVTKADEKLDTWEECIKYLSDLEYITNESEIREIRISNTDLGSADYDLIPKGEGKKLLAFMQLIVCRNAWWKKYNCAVTGKTPTIYIIKSLKNGNVVIDWVTDFMPVLSFNSQKIRDKFYNTFKDLIEQAKDLI